MTNRLQDRVIHVDHGTGTAHVRGVVYDDNDFSPPAVPAPYCLVKFDGGEVLRFRGWQQTSELEDLPPEWDAIDQFAADNHQTIQEIQERKP